MRKASPDSTVTLQGRWKLRAETLLSIVRQSRTRRSEFEEALSEHGPVRLGCPRCGGSGTDYPFDDANARQVFNYYGGILHGARFRKITA